MEIFRVWEKKKKKQKIGKIHSLTTYTANERTRREKCKTYATAVLNIPGPYMIYGVIKFVFIYSKIEGEKEEKNEYDRK